MFGSYGGECVCEPKLRCDNGLECGAQEDGCGGKLYCGPIGGSCSWKEAGRLDNMKFECKVDAKSKKTTNMCGC